MDGKLYRKFLAIFKDFLNGDDLVLLLGCFIKLLHLMEETNAQPFVAETHVCAANLHHLILLS